MIKSNPEIVLNLTSSESVRGVVMILVGEPRPTPEEEITLMNGSPTLSCDDGEFMTMS